MRRTRTKWYAPALLAGLTGLMGMPGCKAPEAPDPSAVVVATAYGDALTVADLLTEIPPGLTPRDSTGWADRIIADYNLNVRVADDADVVSLHEDAGWGVPWNYFLGGEIGTPPQLWADHLAAIDEGLRPGGDESPNTQHYLQELV